MKCPIAWRSLGMYATVAGLSVFAHPADGQSTPATGQRYSPDLLQTLGVGSRSIALGGAYSAIADDASATFWNPGRLPSLTFNELMLEYRPVLRNSLSSTYAGGAAPTTFAFDHSTGDPQLGFFSIVLPVKVKPLWFTSPDSKVTLYLTPQEATRAHDYLRNNGRPDFPVTDSAGKMTVRISDADLADVLGYLDSNTIPYKVITPSQDETGKSVTTFQLTPKNAANLREHLKAANKVELPPTDASGKVAVTMYSRDAADFRAGRTGGKKEKEVVRDYFAISYALGGYLSARQSTTQPNPGGGAPQTSFFDQLARNTFITVAYGKLIPLGSAKKDKGQIGLGIAGFYVNQDYRTEQPTGSPTINNVTTERGNGLGINLGLAYDAPGKMWSVGASYRSHVSLNGLGSVSKTFSTEIPGRASLGVAYRPNGDTYTTITAEVQSFDAANRQRDANGNLALIDVRRAVTDLHIGFEYVLNVRNAKQFANNQSHYLIPLRLGFHTNSNAAAGYTFYDNVISAGIAYQGLDRHSGKFNYSFEPSVEYMPRAGTSLVTFTGRLKY